MQDERITIFLLGLGLFLVSTAVNCQGFIEITVLRKLSDHKDPIPSDAGFYSFAINYLTATFVTLLAPVLIRRAGAKWIMATGASFQAIFLIGFQHLTKWSLYILSGILGAGGGLLWTANGAYLVSHSTPENLKRNSAFMWAMYQGSQIASAIALYLILHNKDFIESYRLMYGIFAGICLLGAGTFASLPTKQTSVAENSDENALIETELAVDNGFDSAVSLLKDRRMQIFLVVFSFIGFETAFLSSIYTSCLNATNLLINGNEAILAYNILFIGFGEIIGGLCFGAGFAVLKGLRSLSIVIIGTAFLFLAYLLSFLNLPAYSTIGPTNQTGILYPRLEISIVNSFFIGIGDSCWQTQIYPMMGQLFDGSPTAFAIQQFFLTFSSAAPFLYGSVLLLPYQILILAIMLLLATTAFTYLSGYTNLSHNSGPTVEVLVE